MIRLNEGGEVRGAALQPGVQAEVLMRQHGRMHLTVSSEYYKYCVVFESFLLSFRIMQLNSPFPKSFSLSELNPKCYIQRLFAFT